jgi:hypothetical protein
MRRHLLASWPVRLAAVACAASVVVLGAAIAAAVRSHPTPRLPAVNPAGAVVVSALDTTSDALVAAAADADPFSPSRTRAETRVASAAEPVVINRQPAAPLQLIGTVMDPAGGDFALCQLGADAPKIVRVGQSVGSYTLRRISQGSASFESSNGDRIELRVSKSGS